MNNRLRFKIGEIEFEAEGTIELIERERDVFLSKLLPSAVNAISQTSKSKQESEIEDINMVMIEANEEVSHDFDEEDLSRTSLSVFLKRYGNISEQDFVLFAAYFDEMKNGNRVFTSEVVKRFYGEARRTEYSNISMLLGPLAKKGYIMDNPSAESANPKQYILTSEGIEYVKKYVPKVEEPYKIKKSNAKMKHVKVESQYVTLNADDLKMDKYVDVCSLKKFIEQMLMVMYIVTNEKKGLFFSVADIQYILTQILGLPATTKQIRGVLERNRKWFYAEQDPKNAKANVYRLLDGGKKYAMGLLGNK